MFGIVSPAISSSWVMGQEQENTAAALDIKLEVTKQRHLVLGNYTSTVSPFYLYMHRLKKGVNVIINGGIHYTKPFLNFGEA